MIKKEFENELNNLLDEYEENIDRIWQSGQGDVGKLRDKLIERISILVSDYTYEWRLQRLY